MSRQLAPYAPRREHSLRVRDRNSNAYDADEATGHPSSLTSHVMGLLDSQNRASEAHAMVLQETSRTTNALVQMMVERASVMNQREAQASPAHDTLRRPRSRTPPPMSDGRTYGRSSLSHSYPQSMGGTRRATSPDHAPNARGRIAQAGAGATPMRNDRGPTDERPRSHRQTQSTEDRRYHQQSHSPSQPGVDHRRHGSSDRPAQSGADRRRRMRRARQRAVPNEAVGQVRPRAQLRPNTEFTDAAVRSPAPGRSPSYEESEPEW